MFYYSKTFHQTAYIIRVKDVINLNVQASQSVHSIIR